jgi:hypothetical protein
MQTVLLVTAVCAVFAAALLALGLYLAPRVLPNLQARVAAADTVEELRRGEASARLTVPEGWVASRGWGDDAALVLRSPDGELSVTVEIADAPPSVAFDEQARDAPRAHDLGQAVTERLASGLDAVHADARDAGMLVAAVGGRSTSSVALVARAPAERLPAYRAAIAALLDSIRVVS